MPSILIYECIKERIDRNSIKASFHSPYLARIQGIFIIGNI